MKKLRIGILFPNVERLESWEYRIFYEIIKSDWAEIVILIKDQRKKEKKNYIKKLLNLKFKEPKKYYDHVNLKRDIDWKTTNVVKFVTLAKKNLKII